MISAPFRFSRPVTRCCFDENKGLTIKMNGGDTENLFMGHTVDLGRGLFLLALVNGRNIDLGSLSISHQLFGCGRKKRETDRSMIDVSFSIYGND